MCSQTRLRRPPESNRCKRLCRPLRNHSARAPGSAVKPSGAQGLPGAGKIGASGVVVGDVAVSLDGAGVAGTGLIGALAVLAQVTALAQVVPGLVELDFELLE